jgi:hypothetical protein
VHTAFVPLMMFGRTPAPKQIHTDSYNMPCFSEKCRTRQLMKLKKEKKKKKKKNK